MAAPFKKGMSYFPLEREVFDDSRFIRLKMKYGSRIMYFYLTLMSHLYATEGYYLDLRGEGRENLLLYLWERCVKYDNGSLEDTEEMLDCLILSGIFDRKMLKKGIITSEHIQEVYYTATAKRKSCTIDPDLWLLSLSRMEELGKRSAIYGFFLNREINDVINSQSKEKKTKEKKSIVKNIKEEESINNDCPTADSSANTAYEAYKILKNTLTVQEQGDNLKMLQWVNSPNYFYIYKYITESGVKTVAQAEPFIEKLTESNPKTLEEYSRLKQDYQLLLN